MEEGVIASWLKKVGDTVKPGDILAEVETDKATMELESYEEGVLLYVGVKEKDSVPVNGIIAIIGEKGEAFEHLLSGAPAAAPKAEAVIPATAQAPAVVEVTPPAAAVAKSSIPAIVVTMPKMSDTMQEGTISAWLKKVGDVVKTGEIIAEVETDKATMELESYEDGVLLYIGVEAGGSVPVDGVIAVIGEKGADYQSLLAAHQGGASIAAPVEVASPAPPVAVTAPAPVMAQAPVAAVVASSTGNERVKASPLAKKIASETGVDIRQVAGSGEGGRIVKRDIETFVPAAAASPQAASSQVGGAPALGQESFTEEKVSQMRKTIAKRLAESKYSAPHFYLTMEINMDKAIEARKSMNEFGTAKISFNDLVIKAAASALRQNPKANSSWLGDKIRYNDHIHIGMAVAVEEGLLVPVIRFADQLSLSQISNQAKSLGQKAKNKELQPKDWEGNTFTISNLGMFGIDEFTAIINPPDACILAVGGIKETVIVKDGQMKIGNVMKVTLSCDHRVVDGAVGSAFLQTLKGLLEDPVRILI